MTTIDTSAIRERVSRTYGWFDTLAAPLPVLEAVEAYHASVRALDDAVVEFEVADADRRRRIKAHQDAVSAAVKAGKEPPKLTRSIPHAEDLELQHGGILAAREELVNEAAAHADRVARQHYGQWRAELVERLQQSAQTVAEVMRAAGEAAQDWQRVRGALGLLTRSYNDRGHHLDETSVVATTERWERTASIVAGDVARVCGMNAVRLTELSSEPHIVEYDPNAGPEQWSAEFLGRQSPAVRDRLQRAAADARPDLVTIPAGDVPEPGAVFLDAS